MLACRDYDWDALGRYKGDNISSLHYVRGRVVEVLRDDTKPDQLDPARSMGTQELRILLLEGANKGTEVTIANYLTRTQNVRLRQGETAIICEDLPDSADAYYTVYNYDRAPVLVLILAVFAAAVVAIGGWKGVRTLLGLGFTGAMIAWLILPGIYHGLPSLPLTVEQPYVLGAGQVVENMGGHAFYFGGRGAGGRYVLPVQHAAAPFRHERYQR